ncbi:MAG: TetR/AcrR family transcriptional regulator [Halieaceae bacterium]
MEASESLPGRREKRKQEIRSRIEDAAYELFKGAGIEDVSIEQICLAADVARRTFYGHFPNKQALLQSLSQSRVWFTADEMMHKIVEDHSSTPQRIAAMIDYMETNIASYSDIDRALILIMPGSLDDENHLRDVSDSLRDHLARVFEQGQSRGDTNCDFTPELLADMVMGTTNTMIVNWAVNPDYPITEKLQEARRLFASVISPAAS